MTGPKTPPIEIVEIVDVIDARAVVVALILGIAAGAILLYLFVDTTPEER